MAQRYPPQRPLKPAPEHGGEGVMQARPGATLNNPQPKRRRVGVSVACDGCKAKRTRCDGQQPCRRCIQAGRECEYTVKSQRATIDTLQARVDQLDQEFNAVKSGTACYATPQVAEDAELSPSESHNKPRREGHALSKLSPRPKTGLSLASPPQKEQEPVGPGPFTELTSWKSTPQASSPAEFLESGALSMPPPPIDSHVSHLQPDTWTRTGWTKAHVRHLIDALFSWEYLSVSHLYHDEFFRDFDNGLNRFCSSALVYAMLAVASRLVNGSQDGSRLLPSGWFGSRVFYDEAERVLQKSTQANNLPNIQALGVLSLYHVRCGREKEAQQLADDFLTSITIFRQRELPPGEDDRHFRIVTSTYCGAVTLTRMLHLATGVLFNVPSNTLEGQLSIYSELSIISQDIRRASNLSVHTTLATIAMELHQLTEFVYNAVSSARSEPLAGQYQAVTIYTKCLEWYQRLLRRIQNEGPRTPFTLFVQYDLDVSSSSPNVKPDQICAQAAHSILTLAQSYEDLFTLCRVPALLPYFVCVAGLYGLGIRNRGTSQKAVHLRQTKRLCPEVKTQPDATGSSDSASSVLGDSSQIKMSAAAHARLLLAKMTATNPAIAAAEQMLFEKT